jgi:pyrroloquinoline quinone biosynthesis protein B
MRRLVRHANGVLALVLVGCASAGEPAEAPVEEPSPRAPAVAPSGPYTVVLGVAQDAGHPQAACRKECCARAWAGDGHRVASLGIVDPASGKRWLIEATPDLPAQMQSLAQASPSATTDLPDGVFVTHAHMGHYTGLVHFGREAMGASGVPIFAMPRMTEFLRTNGPWSQLVDLGNITLETLDAPVALTEGVRVTAWTVPHRDEFSETVGYVIEGSRRVLWLPDIDKWERWDRLLEDALAAVDVAYLDGTFYADGEVGRPMSEIPHPFISETMARLAPLPASERSKVRFIHFNHTNPALNAESPAATAIQAAGFHVAAQSETQPL